MVNPASRYSDSSAMNYVDEDCSHQRVNIEYRAATLSHQVPLPHCVTNGSLVLGDKLPEKASPGDSDSNRAAQSDIEDSSRVCLQFLAA